MANMSNEGWLETLNLTCLIIGDFAVSVSQAVDYTPETLHEVEQAIKDAEEGKAHAEKGMAIADALLAGKVTARSPEAYEMLAAMLDITEWHFSYLARHITPTEDMLAGYIISKSMISALAEA